MKKKKPEHAKSNPEPVDIPFFKPIIVIDSEPQIFKLFLQYIHTGVVNITSETTLPFLHLARKYEIESLQRECIDFANSVICVENALEFLQGSINFHETLLAQKCFELIDSNTAEALKNPFLTSLTPETFVQILWRDTLTIDELELFEKLTLWSSKQTDEVKKKEFPSLLHHIRLATIPPSDILKKIKPTGVFSSEALLEALEYQVAPEKSNAKHLEKHRKRGQHVVSSISGLLSKQNTSPTEVPLVRRGSDVS